MMADSDTILVIGATGVQGGATARALASRGRSVRALVRDPCTPAAQELAADGVTLVCGDLNKPQSLRAAMTGVRGVFSVQTFMTSAGLGGEVRQGRAVAEAAAVTGVEHVVYTSVGGAERESGVPHFDSKRAVERYLRELGVPTTVLRPTFFMENFAAHGPQVVDGVIVVRLALKPDTRVQLIAAADIGEFAARVFEDPDRYAGIDLEIAGDELTAQEIAGAFAAQAGMPARFEQLGLDQVAFNGDIPFSHEIAIMFEWLQTAGFAADIGALRASHPRLQTFSQWLSAGGWTGPVGQG